MFKKNLSAKYLGVLALLVAPLAIWGVISFGATSITLNFSITQSGLGGTVTGSGISCPGDCSQSFTLGSAATSYQFNPKSGFRFRGWDTDGDGVVNYTNNPLSVSHAKSWNIKAIVKRVTTFSTSPSDGSGGYVTGNQVNCPTDCYVFYDSVSSTYAYVAHPINGYKFEGWDVGKNGTIDSRSLTYNLPLNQSLSVKAVFVKAPTCSLTVSPTTINRGKYTRLSWASSFVSYLKSSWAGNIATSGSVSFAPSQTKTYSVTASNYAGSKTCSAKVTVIQPKTTTPSSPGTSTPTTPRIKRTVTAKPTATSNVADSVAPSKPEGLMATYEISKGSVYLEWAASTDNVAVQGYVVQRREKGQGAWVTVTTDVYSANYLDLAVGNEKIYEYQVRAFDGKKNYSTWSDIATVSTGAFQPNATVGEGGSIANDDQTVLVEVNAGDIEEDLFFSIEPVELIQIDYGKGYRSVSTIYEIRAKNSKGEEVTEFKSPITIKFGVDAAVAKEISAKTVRLALSEDSLTVKMVEESKFDTKTNVVTADVAHLTPYMVVAKNKSSFLVFLKNASIVLLVITILALPFAYWYYRKYKQQQSYTELQDELKY